MKRSHRAMTIALLVLASRILIVEALPDRGLYPRIIMMVVLTGLCLIVQRLSANLLRGLPNPAQESSRSTLWH